MAMKKTLLEIVQSILSDLDGDNVNAISDSNEAQQIATLAESVFYDMIATKEIPEHKELIKLTALADSAYPTHFQYPENVKQIETIWYDTSDTGAYEYHEIVLKEPLEFLHLTDRESDSYTTVSDKNAGTKLRITNNKQPDFYTSFDDNYVIMNSHKSTVDSTLQASKIRCLGTKYPVFSSTDDAHVPDIDATFFPMYMNELRSLTMDILKGGTTPKVDQAARRQKNRIQNDLYKRARPTNRPNFGRR